MPRDAALGVPHKAIQSSGNVSLSQSCKVKKMALTIAETLADYVLSRRDDLDLARPMQIYALDTLAVMLAGSTAPSSLPVARTLLEAAGRGEAIVLGHDASTSAWDAALANGAFAHALELDDDHRTAVLHPGAVVVPAALAMAEAEGASGGDFLFGLYAGYEIMCRLGEVFSGKQFLHGIHPTAVCGVFGAAMAASVVGGLDQGAIVRALGIAGTQASGLTEWRADGSWIKRLHPGRAAQSGVLAARLALSGFTGPATIFEGQGGFFNAFTYGEAIDAEAMTRGLGTRHLAFETAIKPYPCCRFEHGAVDLAIEARRAGIKADSIRSIRLGLFRTGVLTYHPVPRNAVDAQFNVPYAVATALLHGTLTLRDFTEEAIGDPDILRLCRLVSVVERPDFDAAYPGEYHTELTIELVDGREMRWFTTCPSGDPAAERYRTAPDLLRSETRLKIVSLLEETGFADRVAPLEEGVASLVAAPTLGELSRLLGRSPGTPKRPAGPSST